MRRRTFLQGVTAGAALTGAAHAETQNETAMKALPILANPFVIVYESPDPKRVYAYSPGLAILPGGRLVATMDQGGPGTAGSQVAQSPDGKPLIGKIFTSDDHGRTWTHRADTPLMHARPFTAEGAVYVLGHAGDLGVMRSRDGGLTWEGAFWLTKGEAWHQAPCNVHYTRGSVYLVMEVNTNKDPDFRGWAVSRLAPVVMRGRETDDLTRRENWTFSNRFSFQDVLREAGPPNLLGVPFFNLGKTAPNRNHPDKRWMYEPGWLETNIVEFTDPAHVWFDPAGRTFYLWARAHTGSTNLACIARAVEGEDGAITVGLAHAPSGVPMVYAPCPGGQMKFHILYDTATRLYWLLSSQATDSMTRPELLDEDRFNLPNNERQRLVLHFSKNCVDWCFAGRVADTGAYKQSRHYASMVIDGEDLRVLSRSGDARADGAHDGNLITFHTVRNFRALAY
ncbi:MAG: glycoside hydrolase [bacterium]|nr:glycoside hydrolase [bacterium]